MDQLTLLRLFADVAEQGSLSKAARLHGVSASTATLALQSLEKSVGSPLAIRTTRRLSLTPEGERLLADCRRILADLEEAMNNVTDRDALQGDIRVTAPNDVGRTRIAGLIDEFMRMNPAVRVALMLTDAVVDLVEDGYHVGIRTGPLPDSRFIARLLLRGRRHVCAAPEYWDRHGKPQHPRELIGHNCLVLARPGSPQTNWDFHEGPRTFSVKVRGDRTVNDGAALRTWALTGAGVVLKSSFDIEADLVAGQLETALEPFTQTEINLYAVSPADPIPRRVRALLDHFSEGLGRKEIKVKSSQMKS
jgi:DNA-binding transcriptional LysR family regulator